MGRTLVLRKCLEHDDCQLQQLNGGEWEHTPAARHVAERLSLGPESQQVLEAQLANALGTTRELASGLQTKGERADSLLARLDGATRQLASSSAILQESLYLAAQLRAERAKAEGAAAALRVGGERAQRATEHVDERAHALEVLEGHVEGALARAQETLVHLSEKTDRVDASVARLDDYVEKLNRVQGLYDTVTQLGERWKNDVAALNSRMNGLDHDLKHERQERLDNTLKVQRQFREVNRA